MASEPDIFQPELRITTEQTSVIVRCKVCNGPYNGAKTLPCQHSMCRDCLERNAGKKSIICPVCENKHNFLSGTRFQSFPDDVVITMDFGSEGECQSFAISTLDKRESFSPINSSEAPIPRPETSHKQNLDEVNFEYKPLHIPLALVIDTVNDDIYIAEFGAQQISVFNKNAQLKSVIKGEGHTEFTPTGVSLNSRRQIVVTDIIKFRILTFGRSGYFIREFGGKGTQQGQLQYPKGVDCHKGLIYVSDKKRVQVYRENGHFLASFGEDILCKPTSLAFSKNLIVVSDAENGLFTFDYKGNLVDVIGEKGTEFGQLRSPFGVTFDSDGYILVANGFNHRIDVFKTNGDFVTTFAQGFFIVRSVAFMKDRRLVVVHGDRFQIYSTTSHRDRSKRGCAIL